MQGIQHLIRQHAVEKQPASWHAANNSYLPYGRPISTNSDTINEMKPPIWNQGT